MKALICAVVTGCVLFVAWGMWGRGADAHHESDCPSVQQITGTTKLEIRVASQLVGEIQAVTVPTAYVIRTFVVIAAPSGGETYDITTPSRPRRIY